MILEAIGTGLIMPVLSHLTDPTSLDGYQLFHDAILYLNLDTEIKIVLFLLVKILIIPNLLKFLLLIFLSFFQSKFTYDFQTSLSKGCLDVI